MKNQLYRAKDRLEKALKRNRFCYWIGHRIKLGKERRLAERQNRAVQQYGLEAMRRVQEVLEAGGYRFFFSCGSLLGIVREGGMIPHDLDLDIALEPGPDFSWEALDGLLKAAGFIRQRSFLLDGEVLESTWFYKHVGVDIYTFHREGENMVSPFFYRRSQERYSERWEHDFAEMVDPHYLCVEKKPVRAADGQVFEVSVPDNYEAVLAANYGPNWRVPDPHWDLWQAPNLRLHPGRRGKRINHCPLKSVQP